MSVVPQWPKIVVTHVTNFRVFFEKNINQIHSILVCW